MYKMTIYGVNDKTAQSLVGTWENAIEILNGRHADSNELMDHARRFVTNVIDQFTTEPTEGLADWVAEGDWNGTDFGPESCAEEWDNQQRSWRAEQESYEN